MDLDMANRKESLDILFQVTLDELIKRIQEGLATPADLSVARAILKDNNIHAISEDKQKISSLVESMPFDDDE
jgi:hypothetical protein